jgi:hypothetical protein
MLGPGHADWWQLRDLVATEPASPRALLLVEPLAADAGYWNEQQMDDVDNNEHIPVLVAPDKGSRATPKRWLADGRANWMRTVLKSEDGHRRYAKRNKQWSRSTVTPNTTEASSAFTAEAE